MITLYDPNLPLLDEEYDTLPDSERKHLRTFRVSTGAALRIVDGRGNARQGTLRQFDKTHCTIGDLSPADSLEPSDERIIILGKIAQDRLEWAVEALVPLGVSRVFIVPGERSQPDKIRIERLERIAVSAMKQCGRSRLPEFVAAASIQSVMPEFENSNLCKWLTSFSGKLLSTGTPVPKGASTVIAVGPEGGFTIDEEKLFTIAGFTPVTLGNRTMRTELAAVVALARLVY